MNDELARTVASSRPSMQVQQNSKAPKHLRTNQLNKEEDACASHLETMLL